MKPIRWIALALSLTALLYSASLNLRRNTRTRVITSDAEGYYQYLPAWFIHHDWSDQPYAFPLPNGKPFNKYTCGVAILQMPFFAAARLAETALGLEGEHGKGSVYQEAIALSSVVYTVLGLCLLLNLLLRHLKPAAAWATIAVLLFGTNLFYYCTGEPGMSHAYSFFLIAAVVRLTPGWWQLKSPWQTLGLAWAIALAALVRPTNAVVVLFPLLAGITSARQLGLRIKTLVQQPLHFILILSALLVWIPQVHYWHLITGKWWVYSYEYSYKHEAFIYWASPRLVQTLLGFQSGWLVYAPLMVLAFLGWRALRQSSIGALALPAATCFLLTWYLCSSWWAYTFSASFGYRALCEHGAYMALPLGAWLNRQLFVGARWRRMALVAALGWGCKGSVAMAWHYRAPWDGPGFPYSRFKHELKRAYRIPLPKKYVPYEGNAPWPSTPNP